MHRPEKHIRVCHTHAPNGPGKATTRSPAAALPSPKAAHRQMGANTDRLSLHLNPAKRRHLKHRGCLLTLQQFISKVPPGHCLPPPGSRSHPPRLAAGRVLAQESYLGEMGGFAARDTLPGLGHSSPMACLGPFQAGKTLPHGKKTLHF